MSRPRTAIMPLVWTLTAAVPLTYIACKVTSVNSSSRLVDAVWRGDKSMVGALLNRGYNPNVPDYKNNPPLIIAARRGDEGTLRLLLEHGADVRGRWGAQALCAAAQQGHAECVQLLIQFGADPNAANAYGESALSLAKRARHPTVVKILEIAIAKPG